MSCQHCHLLISLPGNRILLVGSVAWKERLKHVEWCFLDPAAVSGEKEERLWTKHRPFLASVAKRWNLCRASEDDDKITMHLELDIRDSGLSYLPGDALGIYPNNRPGVCPFH